MGQRRTIQQTFNRIPYVFIKRLIGGNSHSVFLGFTDKQTLYSPEGGRSFPTVRLHSPLLRISSRV